MDSILGSRWSNVTDAQNESRYAKELNFDTDQMRCTSSECEVVSYGNSSPDLGVGGTRSLVELWRCRAGRLGRRLRGVATRTKTRKEYKRRLEERVRWKKRYGN